MTPDDLPLSAAGAHDRPGMLPRDPLNPPIDNLANQKG